MDIVEKKKMKKKIMDLLGGVQEFWNPIFHFPIIQPNLKEANILFLGQNVDCKKAVISSLSDEVSPEYLTSWEFSNLDIKFKFFDLGEHRIAHRAWSDCSAKMDGVVYIVNADALTTEELLGTIKELNALLSDEAFAEVPVLIFGVTATGALFQLKERLCYTMAHPLKVDAADAYDKERFAESKKERDVLLSDEALANVPFHILANKIDIPYAASEDELCFHLGLTNFTTGKGKVNLADSNVRPLEVFMCSIVSKMGYGDGFKWLSQYIK